MMDGKARHNLENEPMLDILDEEHSFTWQINNFTSLSVAADRLPPTKISASIVTGTSDRTKSVWNLHITCQTVFCEYRRLCGQFLCIYMKESEMNNNVKKVEGEISLLTSNDEKYNTKEFSYSQGNFLGLQKLKQFIPVEDLLADSSKLLSNDSLTVLFDIRIWYNYSFREFQSVELTQSNKSHKDRFISDIMDLFQRSRFCDVTIHCKGVELKAHKAILSARSPVFSRMFEHEVVVNNTIVVKIEDVSGSIMEKLLRFMYGQDLDDTVSPGICADLYVAADKYEILELKGKCAGILSSNLSVENVCKVAVLADLHKDYTLFSAAELFAKKRASEICVSKEWLNLSSENYELARKLLY